MSEVNSMDSLDSCKSPDTMNNAAVRRGIKSVAVVICVLSGILFYILGILFLTRGIFALDNFSQSWGFACLGIGTFAWIIVIYLGSRKMKLRESDICN